MFEPDTPVLTHVRVTRPWVHPVVRPTLFAVCPTVAAPCPLIENSPAISSEPLFGPVVRAIAPSLKFTALSPALKFGIGIAASSAARTAVNGAEERWIHHLCADEFVRHLIERLVVVRAVHCALIGAAVSGRDIAGCGVEPGVEAEAAHVLREADLQTRHDRPHLVSECRHAMNGVGFDEVHGLRRHAQPGKLRSNEAFDAAIQNTHDETATRLVGIGEDDSRQFKEGQQTLVQNFEGLPALRLRAGPAGERQRHQR